VRATDHAKDGVATFSRNDYSRRQAFNADSSLFLTTSSEGSWYVYDARTLGKPKALPGLSGDAEPQWHPTDPNTLYYGFLNGGLQIMALDVRGGSNRVVIDLKGKLPWPSAARAWTKSEGSPSADARYWGLQVETEGFEILGFAVWDMVKNKLVGTKPSSSRPDHVSMSPSGRWFVISGDDGTVAWAPDFSRKRPLHKRSEHSDLAIGANGHDIYVSVDYQTNEGFTFMTDIDSGERTNLLRTYVNGSATDMHFSGKAFAKPGWALVSTHTGGGPPQWFMDKVFAMELKANPRVYQIAAHHSAVKGQYMAEPHATANREFTRVLFNSNWGIPASMDVDAYMVRLPKGAFP
jgi:WD40 repeat protein